MAEKWIQGAIKHPGALHKQLGVAQGKKIPAAKLAKAAKAGGKLGQRARLAETLKGMHHKGHKKEHYKHGGEKHETHGLHHGGGMHHEIERPGIARGHVQDGLRQNMHSGRHHNVVNAESHMEKLKHS